MNVKSLQLTKWTIGLILMGLFLFYGGNLLNQELELGLFLFIGLGLGYTEARSRSGLSSGYIDFYIKGDSLLIYNFLALLGFGLLVAVGVHYQTAVSGGVPDFQASGSQAVIPGTSIVTPVDFGLILGSFLMGVGLTMNRGCGLGTLRKIGQGRLRYFWTFLFLLIGMIPGQMVKFALDNSFIHQYNVQVYLPDYLGYTGTIIGSLSLLFFIGLAAKHYENKRKKRNTYRKVRLDKIYPVQKDQSFRLFSQKTFTYLFYNGFPRIVSVIVITIALFLALTVTGETLEVTEVLLAPAVGLFQILGFSLESPAFNEAKQILEYGLLNNTNLLQNISIIFGAMIFSLTSTRLYFSWEADTLKEILLYMISGFLIGFGAVLASGCIIGALYSGIVNFSLSGWAVLASMSLGIILTVKIMNGKISTISKI